MGKKRFFSYLKKHKWGKISDCIVNRYTGNVDNLDVLYATHTKKESAALDEPAVTNNSLRITDSNISISNLLDYVNKYFSYILPEDVLRHYGHTERPSGDVGESALYSDRDITTMAETAENHFGTTNDVRESG